VSSVTELAPPVKGSRQYEIPIGTYSWLIQVPADRPVHRLDRIVSPELDVCVDRALQEIEQGHLDIASTPPSLAELAVAPDDVVRYTARLAMALMLAPPTREGWPSEVLAEILSHAANRGLLPRPAGRRR
jgi:hypothetical protein